MLFVFWFAGLFVLELVFCVGCLVVLKACCFIVWLMLCFRVFGLFGLLHFDCEVCLFRACVRCRCFSVLGGFVLICWVFCYYLILCCWLAYKRYVDGGRLSCGFCYGVVLRMDVCCFVLNLTFGVGGWDRYVLGSITCWLFMQFYDWLVGV